MSQTSGPHRPEDEIVGQTATPQATGLEGGRAAPKAAAPPPPEAAPAAAPKPEDDSWVETVKTVAYALLLALVIRSVFFQPFVIPSGSMKDTLLIGDYVFVEKFAYGYSRYSLPWGLGPLGSWWHGRIWSGAPKRGDVVVFKMPNPNSSSYMEDFIKRVIGLPGDRVQMINDRLYVNGQIVPQTAAGTFADSNDGVPFPIARFRETLPGGKTHDILDITPTGPADNTEAYVVPPGHYFMMGDNRDDSDDSRAEVGFVPAENLVGKAEIIFFSLDEKTSWWQIWYWPWAIRWSRIFKLVE